MVLNNAGRLSPDAFRQNVLANGDWRRANGDIKESILTDNKYLVFTRKWRPQTFEEIMGQDQVTIPLKRAIESGRIMHAYLFSGPRGVGKTTTARVFAKALNCEKGPTAHPCNTCATCRETMDGSSLDIIEIDGASNRGIESIRELREHVGFSAAKSKYKIYIVDEVHMLTPEAFNAFLKTLEEPPPHVIFVFATTNPDKLPQTILSRCQHFRFRRMPASFMIDNLKMIAAKENIKYEEEALISIAKSADGAMRDAQRIFDQAVTYAKGEVLTGKLAAEMLGEIGTQAINSMIAAIAAKDIRQAVSIAEEVFTMGYDLKHFLKDFIELVRDMLVIKTTGSRETAVVGDEEYEFLKKTGETMEKGEILFILQKAIDTYSFLDRTNTPDITVEAFIMEVIINSGGQPAAQAVPLPGSGSAFAQGASADKKASGFAKASDFAKASSDVLSDVSTDKKATVDVSLDKSPDVPAEKSPDAVPDKPADAAQLPKPAVKEQAIAAKTEEAPGHIMIESIEEKEEIKNLTKEILEKRWENIIDKAKSGEGRADLAQALETAGIVSYEDTNLFLVGDNPFMTNILEKGRDAIKELIKEEFNTAVTLIIQDKEDYRKKYQVKKNVDEEEAKNHPLVRDLGKIFRISQIDIKKKS